MKILFVHAHYDDFEFFAGGTFELWRRRLGDELKARVLVCTDGAGGHYFRSREETARMRWEEQVNSARIGGYEFDLLRLPDGRVPREACLNPTPFFLAALWKAIRDFQPDYLFCPPLVNDPLAGVHLDHLAVAEAIRKVAYLINVPHAFTPEYPADETASQPCPVPVILNCYDSYLGGANQFDLAIDIEDVFTTVCDMSFCHQTQIMEWLPWVGRHEMEAPGSFDDWVTQSRVRLRKRNRALGLPEDRAWEVFTVTAWGTVPSVAQLLRDLPNVDRQASRLDALRARLGA